MPDGKRLVRHHPEWEIYRHTFDASTVIFALSEQFPLNERNSLADRIRRSSRSVCLMEKPSNPNAQKPHHPNNQKKS
ncbi:MAG: four helix bundle protein [Caldilineaceae bacterium]|nr:four helix bundle protein [Caldilineaceae bacterium]